MLKLKQFKVNYQKHWGNDGTCYSQTIKIDKDFKDTYNGYLRARKNEIENKFKRKHSYSEEDLKIKSLEYLQDGVNYTNLIHLGLFLEIVGYFNLRYYKTREKQFKNYRLDFSRVLWRNTIIEII